MIGQNTLDIGDAVLYIDGMNKDIIMPLRMPREMVEAVEIYWHQQRLPSRVAAIRELLAYALDAKLAGRSPKEKRR